MGLNGFLRFGTYHQHQTADVSFLVNIGKGTDISNVKVTELDRKSILELARELSGRASKVRHGQDEEFKKSTNVLRSLPTWALRPTLGA